MTTTPKKIVCVDEMSIPLLQKNNGPSLSLYKQMCCEFDEHVIVSQSQFYNLMEKQLPNVVIPKVKMTVVRF
jgi:hypothetical protein